MSLSILNPPQTANTPVDIDIVAVHGLGGNATKTWTHPKSKAFWLKDFLPQRIPDARIMTFGYNADMAFGRSCADVIDHAKSLLSSLVDKRDEPETTRRPLIFIAHSLGGVVVKQALLQACLEARYHSIKEATLGLIFLGTPHRGSDKAKYGKVLANVAHAVTHRPPAKLLTALGTNSETLLRLNTDFCSQIDDISVYSFYEQQVMTGFSTLIVEKHSALLDISCEEQIPVDADHRAMARYERDDDSTFEKIHKRIERMKNSVTPILEEQLSQHNQYFEVPHLLSPIFTGRNEDLQRLIESFQNEGDLRRQHQRRFVLFGLGGSGKTQLCLKYLHEQRNRYWGIFWVDASSPENIQQSFTSIARILQVDGNIDSVKRRLTNAPQDWLLVIDNADNPQINLSPYLPAGNQGDIIITSRNPNCSSYNTVGCQEIGQLSPEDAFLLLVRTVQGGAITLQDNDLAVGHEIVEAVGYLALAIVQAGSYIREINCSPLRYLELYKRRKKPVLEYLSCHTGTDYSHSVYTTWEVSIEAIESRQDAASHQALKLLDLLGFYHHDRIPIQMFFNIWDRPPRRGLPDYSPWSQHNTNFLDFQQAVESTISLLASFSLVTRNAGTLSLHPLVHAWCRDRMDDREKCTAYRRALTLLTATVQLEYESKDYMFRRSLVDHVFRLLEHRDQVRDSDEKMQAHWWSSLALILHENGRFREALLLRDEAVKLMNEVYGHNHPKTFVSTRLLAVSYREVGEHHKSLELLENSLSLQEDRIGDDHFDKVEAKRLLAACYSESGRPDEGVQLLEGLLRLQRNKLGDDHPDTWDMMDSLAVAYSNLGREGEAIELTEKVLRYRRDKFGYNHPDTLGATYNLARYYGRVELWDKAIPLGEEAVESGRHQLGDRHPETLSSMHNLALFYSEAGQLDKAISLGQEAVASRRHQLGDRHPDTLNSIHNLAVAYERTGQFDKAIMLAEEAVDSRIKVHEDDHKDTKDAIELLEKLTQEAAEASSMPVEASSLPAKIGSSSTSTEGLSSLAETSSVPESSRESRHLRSRFRDLLRLKRRREEKK